MITRKTHSLDWIARELGTIVEEIRPGFQVIVDRHGRGWVFRCDFGEPPRPRGFYVPAPHARTLLWFTLTDILTGPGFRDVREQLIEAGYFNLN